MLNAWKKANEIKQQIDVIDNSINTIDKADMIVDKSPMDKNNGDVSPAPNIIDGGMCEEGEENCNNNVAPGPQGIVGVVGPDDDVIHGDDGVAGDDSGGGDDGGNVVEDSNNDITGEVVKNSDNFIKRLLDWLFKQ